MNSYESTGQITVAERIAAAMKSKGASVRITDVRIGLGYTAVRLADGRTGLAYTFKDDIRAGCTAFKGQRPLASRPASDLLPLINSTDTIEAGVGLACANALVNTGDRPYIEGDLLDYLEFEPDDHVGMVGYFGPLVAPLKKRVSRLTIFERIPEATSLLRSQKDAAMILPRCQAVVITATAVINHSVDDLLHAARDCREVVLLGPSTTLLPEAFEQSPVTLLSGMVVRDPDRVLQVVSEGGGTRAFVPYVRKVSLRLRDPRTESLPRRPGE